MAKPKPGGPGVPGGFGFQKPLHCGLVPKLQAASLRFGTTLTLRPVSRPSSAAQVATLVRRAVEGRAYEEKPPKVRPVSAAPNGPARIRPQSAAKPSQGFAPAAAESQPVRRKPDSTPSHSHHIGRLVGRHRVAHMAAATQAHQSPPKRVPGAPSRGSSAPNLRPALREVADAPLPGYERFKRPSQEKREGTPGIFEEIIRTDEFFGPILKEIKASYTAGDQHAFHEASPAEIAVDAIRRPWIEDQDEEACDTERAGSASKPAAEKVRRLEQENFALRELLRRFHGQLKRTGRTGPGLVTSASAPSFKKVSPELSVWSSPEPLAAAMRRPPPDRPSSVPALNLSEIDDQSYYDEEEEEEEDDYYEDYPLHNPTDFGH